MKSRISCNIAEIYVLEPIVLAPVDSLQYGMDDNLVGDFEEALRQLRRKTDAIEEGKMKLEDTREMVGVYRGVLRQTTRVMTKVLEARLGSRRGWRRAD
jgi:hypothetical protein